MRNNNRRGWGLTDLCAVLAGSALLFVVSVAALAQARGKSRGDLCGANLQAIGRAAQFYANDNGELWMIPPFKRLAVDSGGVDYLAGDTIGDPPTNPGEVGFDREVQSTSEIFSFPEGGSTAVSATRAFWLLVRSGDIDTGGFVCPVSRDTPDPAVVPEWYYDFSGYDNISYGYQMPFGPRDTRPREGADSRQVFAADKGSYYLSTFEPTFRGPARNLLTLEDRAAHWRKYNSPNHHGRGQNVLFADGHVSFERTPTVGIHGDNIYTVMTDVWDKTGFNRIHGESPHFATAAEFPYPGQDAFGLGTGLFASTDSLIYP